MMTRIRFFSIGAVLMFALTTVAQQTTNGNGNSVKGVPSSEEQLKALTAALELTSDQQAKIKPILQQLHDATVKLVTDKSLSQEQRLAKVKPLRYDTDRKMRAVLSDEQQKKLDQYEHEYHPEMHGSLDEGTP